MNKQKFIEVADLLQYLSTHDLNAHFDMGIALHVHELSDKQFSNGLPSQVVEAISCGTVACICGWRIILDGLPWLELGSLAGREWIVGDLPIYKVRLVQGVPVDTWLVLAAESFGVSVRAMKRIGFTESWPSAFYQRSLDGAEAEVAEELLRAIGEGWLDPEDAEAWDAYNPHGWAADE